MSVPLVIPSEDRHKYGELHFHAAGSEAEVYTAMYVPTGDRVALKVLIPRSTGTASRERREKRFLREASLLRKAGGAHVVRVYDVLDVRLRGQDTKAFSMEWLAETLRDVTGRHHDGLPVEDLERYLRHAIEGLRALHDNVVAVRDLRPENLLLSERGELKIADLGMARTDDSAASLVESSRYMAPEVLDGSIRIPYGDEQPPPEAYFPVDVYGLGMTFYEAAVGAERWESLPVLGSVYRLEGPSSGLDRNQRWRDWQQDRASRLPPMREVRHDVPETLAAALDGMVVKEREARVSLSCARRLLDGAAMGPGTEPGRQTSVQPSAGFRRWVSEILSKWAYAVAGALVLVGIAEVASWVRETPLKSSVPEDTFPDITPEAVVLESVFEEWLSQRPIPLGSDEYDLVRNTTIVLNQALAVRCALQFGLYGLDAVGLPTAECHCQRDSVPGQEHVASWLRGQTKTELLAFCNREVASRAGLDVWSMLRSPVGLNITSRYDRGLRIGAKRLAIADGSMTQALAILTAAPTDRRCYRLSSGSNRLLYLDSDFVRWIERDLDSRCEEDLSRSEPGAHSFDVSEEVIGQMLAWARSDSMP